MNRTLLIAHREVMAYVKTVGFWLSLLSLPFFAVLGGFMPTLLKRAEPVQNYILVEEAGPTASSGLASAVREALEKDYDRSCKRTSRKADRICRPSSSFPIRTMVLRPVSGHAVRAIMTWRA